MVKICKLRQRMTITSLYFQEKPYPGDSQYSTLMARNEVSQ